MLWRQELAGILSSDTITMYPYLALIARENLVVKMHSISTAMSLTTYSMSVIHVQKYSPV
jgi:hypothetical protein